MDCVAVQGKVPVQLASPSLTSASELNALGRPKADAVKYFSAIKPFTTIDQIR
jgi:hypothetical protein